VQLAWTTEWEDTGGGLRAPPARGATVFKYVFDNVQAGDRTTGFCAQGTAAEAQPSRMLSHNTACQIISITS
jgi:hypothetical protein